MNNQVLQLMAAGGPFVGNWRAQSRVTVEPAFYLNQSSGPVGNRPLAKCPVRWWQRADNSQVEVEIPNVRQVQMTYDLTQTAATVEIDILNTNIPANGLPQDLATSLGQPGFFSWTYASTAAAQARWNQTPNTWSSVLRENALIRVYQGYGGFNDDGSPMSIPDAVSGGYLLLKGVFLLDNPAIDSGGITKLTGRNMAKLLIDQQTIPPVIPKGKYPLSYWGPGQATKTLTWQAVPGYGTGAWAAQRGVYDSDSHNNPVGVQLAIDGNPATAWVSENAGSTGGQVWLQLDCNELVSGIYINPMWGNYTCYVSIFSNGGWQGTGSVGGVPVVTAFFVGFEKAQWHKLPRTYMASKIRLTFTNLFHWGAGYYAAAHEISLGSTGVVTTREKIVLDIDPTPSGKGYRLFGSDGGVFDYGDAIYHGSLSGRALNAGIIGGATTTTNKGYWLAGADGGVFTFGDATFHGSLATITLAAPIVAFRRTPSGGGYYMLGADGGVFTFGDATFHGSGTRVGGINFVDMVPRPQNDGYWLLGEDGGVFAFGNATYHGRGPVGGGGSGLYVGMDGTPSGLGYWLVANDGAVFSLGDAVYHGGANVPSPQDPSGLLAAPISGIRRSLTGNGYRLVGQDGGVFDYGDAVFYGSLPGSFAETYALPADYSDYCLDVGSEAFTKRGWLRHDEIGVGDEVLGINYDTGRGEWHKVTDVYRRHRQREMVAFRGASFDALTTPEHRWLTRFGESGRMRWTTSDAITATDHIPLVVPPDHLPTRSLHSDAFVELVGWFWTEGSWKQAGAQLSQSRQVNPNKVERIANCLKSLYGEPGPIPRGRSSTNVHGPYWRTTERSDSQVLFNLSKRVADDLRLVMDRDKAVGMAFLSELTYDQLGLFIETSLAADGCCRKDGYRSISQRVESRIKAFEMACVLAGIPFVTHERSMANRPAWTTSLLKTDYMAPVRSASRNGRATVTRQWYEGIVWCPQTELGNFVARRNGSVYLTGNSDIIKDLALWAGFWLHPTGGIVATGRAPDVYGVVETTGAWDTIGPLGIDFFDKRPVIDVMTDIANLVGYLVRVDDQGGFRFEAPNIWAIGNFYDDGTSTTVIPVIDERTNLSDYVMTGSDQDLRSPIVVAVADPYLQGGAVAGTNVTTFIPPYTPLLRGITKSAMFAVPLQVDAKDQQYFAELIALRIWFQTRTGTVTAWCNPTIEVDDQVRIYERTTAETNVHYVSAISTSHDLVAGKFEMQLTTYWLGGHDVGWAVTADLNTFFGAGAAKPVTVMTPGNPNNSFLLSAQLTQQLTNSGAAATRPLNG